MSEELSFGAAQDRSQLPLLRRDVDQLMSKTGPSGPAGPAFDPPSALSPASVGAIRKARDKVIPFVPDEDRRRLEALVAALEAATPQDEDDCRLALERELRVHSYLLV
jgi:hypothetical protein